MTLEQLAADIASRVPAMAQDSPLNNAQLIQSMIQDYLREQAAEEHRYIISSRRPAIGESIKWHLGRYE